VARRRNLALSFALAACASSRTTVPPEPLAVDVAANEPSRRVRVGVVDARDVHLDHLDLRLSEARRCPRARLPAPDGGVVTASAASRAGCRLYPFRGRLGVFVERPGEPPVRVMTLHTDHEGRVRLDYARVDVALRAVGDAGLHAHRRLLLGTDAWAGTVDLDALRTFLANWHLEWVSRGRGSPALFVARHPHHPDAARAQRMADAVSLARQREDFERVQAGEMTPAAFLQRHVRSPYRRAALAMLLGETK
jgi:hypothetical protein